MKQLLKLTGCVALAGLMSSCGSVQDCLLYTSDAADEL